MRFFIPTQLYIEQDCVAKYGDAIKKLGTHAFIVTGRSSAHNGSLKAVTDKLDALGIKYDIFDETGENPSVETVMQARDIAAAKGADFVIGVGGGSPLDAAKAVALMAKNPQLDSSVLYKPVELRHLPVVEVPTTAGTGSEITQYSILTIHSARTKKGIAHSVYPALALDDPNYLATLPHKTLINTAVDTLAHLIESYFSTQSQKGLFCEKGLALWGSLKEKIRTNKLDEQGRTDLMLASALGGMAIAHTSTSLPHGLSYKVTYELGIPHGKACGMFLGGYTQNYPDDTKRQKVLALLGFETAAAFKTYLSELIDAKPLDKGFAMENVKAFAQNTLKLKNHPYKVTAEELLKMENLYI